MNKIKVLVAALLLTVSASAAYAACGGGRYQRAVLVGGAGPSVCRVPCKNEGAVATKWGTNPNFPFEPVIVWSYQIQAGANPSTNCPTEVYNAAF